MHSGHWGRCGHHKYTQGVKEEKSVDMEERKYLFIFSSSFKHSKYFVGEVCAGDVSMGCLEQIVPKRWRLEGISLREEQP
ncbi:hypothetical protein DMENIID0001_132970 [Sergentomyia squamirostris]